MKLLSKLPCIVFIMSIVLVLVSCQTEELQYCNHLKNIVIKQNIETTLNAWVSENIVNKEISRDDLSGGGGMWPGDYWFHTNFDWKLLGFEADSQVRLVNVKIDKESKKLVSADSVYFGERSRYGILVKLPGSKGFGVDDLFLNDISNNLAVVCRERD